jgi:hypothetical protein
MSGREREGEEARERAGAGGPRGPEWGWAAADRLVWFFFFFFSNPFQTKFKFKSFSCFQTQILTQIYSTFLRLLENLLNHFSNIKFKLSSFFLIQTFTPILQLFLKTFHKIF